MTSLSNMSLTTEQRTILDRVSAIVASPPSSRDSLIVQARAGAAKTTMLCLIADLLPNPHAFHDQPVFLAFNKAIADELTKRLPSSCRASTFHSLGFSLLRTRFRTKSNPRKYNELIDYMHPGMTYEMRNAAVKIIDRARNNAFMPETLLSNLPDIINALDLLEEDLPDLTPKHYAELLRVGSEDVLSCDFTDMLYLPFYHSFNGKPFSFILVDESQDTNPLQLALLNNFGSTETSYIFVGDDRQAIYGFRGSSSNALDLIAEGFSIPKTNHYTLSTTFRCAQAICAEAQLLVPDLRAKPSAPLGHVYTYNGNFNDFPSESMIVCRNNAPLASVAMRLMRERQPFQILSDFFPRLTKFAEARVKSKHDSLATFKNRLLLWQDERLSALPEQRHEAIIDRVEVLSEICDELGPDAKVTDLTAMLAQLCNSFGSVKLTTIHKAKGLESTNVFFLNPNLLPSKYAITRADLLQEDNLKYVAITRAKANLVYWHHNKHDEPISAIHYLSEV